jgi:uncharacterized protein YneF (UPF0154 family)
MKDKEELFKAIKGKCISDESARAVLDEVEMFYSDKDGNETPPKGGMKDKIVEILHNSKCRSRMITLQEVARRIDKLYSAGKDPKEPIMSHSGKEVSEKYLIGYFDYVNDCDYEDTAGEFGIEDFTKAWLKSNPIKLTDSAGEEVSYTESQVKNLVMDYAAFVIQCMDGEAESTPVGIWVSREIKKLKLITRPVVTEGKIKELLLDMGHDDFEGYISDSSSEIIAKAIKELNR